ncbi:unnamed protein product [Ectocarpus sp. 8 AP-2014]
MTGGFARLPAVVQTFLWTIFRRKGQFPIPKGKPDVRDPSRCCCCCCCSRQQDRWSRRTLSAISWFERGGHLRCCWGGSCCSHLLSGDSKTPKGTGFGRSSSLPHQQGSLVLSSFTPPQSPAPGCLYC